MCLLTFIPPHVQPGVQALINGSYVNDDGHGFAVVIGNRIVVKRGWNASKLAEEFARVRAAHPDGPAMFHSRFGTHGARDKGNVHPFELGGDSRTVIAHNGILPGKVQPRNGDPRSDTRIAAEDHLPRAYGRLSTYRARKAVGRWITDANKIVILTVDRRYRGHSFIINESAGIWDGGIWYSNSGYLDRPEPQFDRFRWTADNAEWLRKFYADPDDIPLTECDNCHSYTDALYGDCDQCGFCFDCEQGPADCQCYPMIWEKRRTSGDPRQMELEESGP